MQVKTNGYYESQRRAKREYKKRHKDKINAYRRSQRALKRKETLGDKKCANCEILLKERYTRGIRLYCAGCIENYSHELRKFQPSRKFQKKVTPTPTVNPNTSWRRVKEMHGRI